MNMRERRDAGMAYVSDGSVLEEQAVCRRLLQKLNFMDRSDFDGLSEVVKELLGKSEGAWINPPFYCDYGSHIEVGKNFFANYNCGPPFHCGGNIVVSVIVCTSDRNKERPFGALAGIGTYRFHNAVFFNRSAALENFHSLYRLIQFHRCPVSSLQWLPFLCCCQVQVSVPPLCHIR